MKNSLRINAGRRYGRALAAVFALATLAASQNFNPASAPPETRAEALVETLHGVKVGDPFRWLEQGESREVRAWTDAQNAYTRRALGSA